MPIMPIHAPLFVRRGEEREKQVSEMDTAKE